MNPKGKLLIIGGAEDKGDDDTPAMADRIAEYERFEVLRELLPKGKHTDRIEVITTGSQIPDEIKKMYQKVFRKIGYTNFGFIHISDKLEAREPRHIDRIAGASAVLFSGGDQFRLSTILGGTPIVETIHEKYCNESDFVVAGTSAGAMVLSRIMICEGGTDEALIGRDLKIASGFGFLETSIVDTHFIKRGRFGRLAHAVIINPGQLGIGLGEDTALVITNGHDAVCHGSGMVVIIDGKDIGQTNITEADQGSPVFVENMKVHLLVRNCRFCLKERRMAVPAIEPEKEKEKETA
jgi:cyanophycinase